MTKKYKNEHMFTSKTLIVKVFRFLFVLVSFTVFNVFAESGEVSITLTSPKNEDFAGDKIIANIRIENKTDNQLAFYRSPPADFIKITCTRDGKNVPLTAYGRKFYYSKGSQNPSGISAVKIFPKEIRVDEINISRLFDTSIEGHYIVTHPLHVFALNPSGKVRVEPKTITVEFDVHPPHLGE